jgi:hypothetical protein
MGTSGDSASQISLHNSRRKAWRSVTLDYSIDEGKHNGVIIRTRLTK